MYKGSDREWVSIDPSPSLSNQLRFRKLQIFYRWVYSWSKETTLSLSYINYMSKSGQGKNNLASLNPIIIGYPTRKIKGLLNALFDYDEWYLFLWAVQWDPKIGEHVVLHLMLLLATYNNSSILCMRSCFFLSILSDHKIIWYTIVLKYTFVKRLWMVPSAMYLTFFKI